MLFFVALFSICFLKALFSLLALIQNYQEAVPLSFIETLQGLASLLYLLYNIRIYKIRGG